MTVLFRAGRLVGLNFLPHDAATDGVKGVLETKAQTELVTADCVALAAGLVGELIFVGQYDPQRVMHDRQQAQRIAGQLLEDFALEAYEVIKQNLLFFSLLNVEVRKKAFAVLENAFSLSEEDYAELPQEIPIITLADVQEIYNDAESRLAGFPEKA